MPDPEPDETPDLDAATRFRKAFLLGDPEQLRELTTPDVFLLVAGAGPLGGRYDAPEGLARFIGDLRSRTNGTLRPWSTESWDVAVSSYHAFVWQSLTWNVRGAEDSSEEVWLLAFEDGKIARVFQYLEDPAPYLSLD